MFRRFAAFGLALTSGLGIVAPAAALDNAISYQGALEESGAPANGTYDLSFQLFDDSTGSGFVSQVVEVGDVPVAKGVFTTDVDFGFATFSTGASLWIEVGVRTGAATGAYQILAPRQALRATPYAHHADTVGSFSVGQDEIVPNEVQRRVTGNCAPGTPIIAISITGAVTCGSASVTTPGSGSNQSIDALGVVGSSLSMIVAGDGRPSIAYHDATNGDLKYFHCLNDSCTLRTDDQMLDSTGVVGINPSMTRNSTGGVNVSYFDQTNSALKFVSCSTVDCSSFAAAQILENTGAVGSESSLDFSAGGTVIAAYRDATNQRLLYLRCQPFGCTGTLPAAPVTIDASANVGTNVVGRLNDDGDFAIAYRDSTNTSVKFATCGSNTCSSPASLTVNAATLTGAAIDFAFASSGYPLIVSVDVNNNLTVTACSNDTCSASTTSSLGIGPAGAVSLAIAPDGIPVIAYYYTTTQDLRFVRCTNPTCAGGAAGANEVILDTISDVGSALDVVVSGDNRPSIAYFDATAGDLKFYKCPNKYCIAYYDSK